MQQRIREGLASDLALSVRSLRKTPRFSIVAILTVVIASVVFGVSPLDPLVLAGATAFLAIVATVAAYLPAHRASNVAPQQVLQGQ
jgi:hypothetical protein